MARISREGGVGTRAPAGREHVRGRRAGTAQRASRVATGGTAGPSDRHRRRLPRGPVTLPPARPTDEVPSPPVMSRTRGRRNLVLALCLVLALVAGAALVVY